MLDQLLAARLTALQTVEDDKAVLDVISRQVNDFRVASGVPEVGQDHEPVAIARSFRRGQES